MKYKENQTDEIVEQIQSLLKSCDDCGERQHIAKYIILQATIWGASNTYEGIGILEIAKQQYKEVCEEMLSEED